MTSPMVEAVRDIPTKNGEGVQMATGDDSGFPFDDRDFDRDGSYSFRTQLDDIAQRHPEFAEHLNFGNFPFRSHTLGRQRRGSDVNPESNPPPGTHESQFRRYADRPFGSRFENFGFPFTRHFEDEPDFYQAQASPPQQQQHQHQQQHPQSHAQQQQQPQYHPNQPEQKQSEPSSPQPTSSDKPPQVPQSQDRGRKQNIQQSNTVDLGQKQDPVDESRGQRSMSAPPENRSTGQRFVSSINIPIHRGGGEMGARTSQPQPETQSQPQPQARPNERVIPIHVEGRDEPVMPKNIHTTFTQPPPQQQQQQQQPQTERIFGRNPSQFTQFLNKGEPHGMTPEEVFKQQQQQYQKQQQQNYQQQQQQQNQQQEEQVPQQPEHKPPKPSQLDQIQSIQKDVSELMNQVEKFSGKPKDKQYLYLDEMLTRNLIKLDNIETEGKDNIRQARKEAIKCIESCIGILEAKANANAASAEQKADDNMDLEKAAAPNASESQASGEAQQEQAGENVPQPSADLIDSEKQHAMDTEPVTLEVSGVVKSGSVANAEVSPMEVASNEQATATEEQSPGSEQKEVTASEAETAVTTEETRPKEGSPPKEGEPDVKQEQGKGEAEVAQDSETSQNCEVDVKTEEKKEKKKGKKKEKTEKK